MKSVLTLQPRMSEKSYGLSETIDTYVFEVPNHANKQDIEQAVAKQYGVKVQKVTIAKTAGKKRRVVKRGGRSVQRGFSAPVKKAYVRLGEGDKLPIFASVAKDDDEKAEKASGKAEKTAPTTDAKKITDAKDSTSQATAKPEKRGRRFGLNIRGNR